MFKIIVSISILGILMIAGLAKASSGYDMQRVQFKKQIILPVSNMSYNAENDTLTVTGSNEGFCLDSIKTQTRVIAAEKRAVITISGANKHCAERTSSYESSVILKDAFVQHADLKGHDILVKVAGSDKSFIYEL